MTCPVYIFNHVRFFSVVHKIYEKYSILTGYDYIWDIYFILTNTNIRHYHKCLIKYTNHSFIYKFGHICLYQYLIPNCANLNKNIVFTHFNTNTLRYIFIYNNVIINSLFYKCFCCVCMCVPVYLRHTRIRHQMYTMT